MPDDRVMEWVFDSVFAIINWMRTGSFRRRPGRSESWTGYSGGECDSGGDGGGWDCDGGDGGGGD